MDALTSPKTKIQPTRVETTITTRGVLGNTTTNMATGPRDKAAEGEDTAATTIIITTTTTTQTIAEAMQAAEVATRTRATDTITSTSKTLKRPSSEA